MKKKAFTLLELMMVVAVISVLIGIVSVAASGAIRNARSKRADAMRIALEQGIAAYYAQEGVWPDVIERKAGSMTEDTYTFTGSEADSILQQVVGKAFGKGGGKRSVLVDASALFVADSSRLGNNGEGCYDNHSNRNNTSTFCGDQKCISGMDFMLAANRNSKSYIPFAKLAFGYQGTEESKFRRFWITYNGKTDAVTVSKENPSK